MNDRPSRYVLGLALILGLGFPCTTALRAQALFQLGSAEARPGQSGVVIPLTITAGADGVGAWSVVIQYDPEAMAVEQIEQAWPAEAFGYQPNSFFTERGRVGALAIATFSSDETWVLLSGQTATVALVHLCILPTAPEGVYTVGFAPTGTPRPNIGGTLATYYSAWRTTDGSDGSYLTPALEPGAIHVRGEPVAASSCVYCVADPPAWGVPPPALPEGALFQLGSAEAQPGQSGVCIPLTITAGGDGVGAWSVVLQYDPEAMAVEEIEQAWPAALFSYRPNSDFTERGVVGAVAVATFVGDETWVLRSGQTATVALIHLCILPTAPEGVYTVGFAPSAPGRPFIGVGMATRYSAWRTPDGSDGNHRTPALELGTIQVRGAPVAASSCVADGPAWVPPPALPEGALFQLGNAEARPGQSGVVIPLTITAGGDGVGAWSVVIQYDPEVMAVEQIEQAWPAEAFGYQPNSRFTERGVVGALAVATFFRDKTRVLLSGQTETVALVRLCILPTAPEGVYTVGFAPLATGRPFIGSDMSTRYSAWSTADGSDGGHLSPALEPGAIQVRGAPVAASSCVADGPAWVPPPAIPEISFALAAPSRAAPGDQITVTWNISTSHDLVGYSAAIDYDEAVLAFEAARVNREWFSGLSGLLVEYISAEDGNLVIFVLNPVTFQHTMPAGPARLAAEIDFTVNPQTQARATQVLFVDTVERRGIPYSNTAFALFHLEDPTSPDRTSVEVQVDPAGGAAMLAIQREAEFLRGDVNDDGAIDISDPISALSFLFLGTSESPCKDATDANDDGTVDISDPVAELRYLFRGGPPAPPPFGGCGDDPTEDPLGCISYSACP
jgi:hypothetical protein